MNSKKFSFKMNYFLNSSLHLIYHVKGMEKLVKNFIYIDFNLKFYYYKDIYSVFNFFCFCYGLFFFKVV